MTDIVRSVPMFQAQWDLARAAWRPLDPLLYAATPEEPVQRLIEEMPTAFGALVRAILHQQVSTAAGRAIVSRLAAACNGTVEPDQLLRLTESDLRSAGLSTRKAYYVRILAERKELLADIERYENEEVVRRLVNVPGIGVWTAKMFLIFHLGRVDVFSGADLGLREGIRILDQRPQPPTPAEAETRAEPWAPYRSVAAVVLWDLTRRDRGLRKLRINADEGSATTSGSRRSR